MNVEDVGPLWLFAGSSYAARGVEIISGLDGVDADRAIEEGSGKEVRVLGAPIDLECPVVSGREL